MVRKFLPPPRDALSKNSRSPSNILEPVTRLPPPFNVAFLARARQRLDPLQAGERRPVAESRRAPTELGDASAEPRHEITAALRRAERLRDRFDVSPHVGESVGLERDDPRARFEPPADGLLD